MTSVLTTERLPPEKSPALTSTPVVLSLVAEPPCTMKQPATVPLLVKVKLTAADVAFEPAEAAENDGVGRLPL